MERYAGKLRNPALAAFARRQADKIRQTEASLCPKVRQCLVITPDDEAKLRSIAPGVRTTIVPGAIDPEEYEPVDPPSGRADLLVVAVGSFGFPPTGEGVVDFVERVWPRALQAFPKARLRLIGHCPRALRRRLAAGERVEVLGRVDRVRPHLEGAHVFMVPLRVGSGMRIRILEALAYQIPVVTTSIGCEGIGVDDGRHLLIADSPGEIVEAIERIYSGPDLARTLRREGRRLVEKSYSLDTVEQLTGRIYRKELQEVDATAAAR
jgi:glycosyltransferase involved in cell wall biosynthesis